MLEPPPAHAVRVEHGGLRVAATAALVASRHPHRADGVAPGGAVPRRCLARGHRSDRSRIAGWRASRIDRFARLRRDEPLYWQEEQDGRGFWSFTRYDDIVAASKDYGSYSSETGGTSLQDLSPEELELRKSMIDTDPPRHTRLRAIVNQGFTPRVVNAYEERIRGLAREILVRAFAQEAADWVSEVRRSSRCGCFSEIAGLPVEDRRLPIDLGDKLLGNTGLGS